MIWSENLLLIYIIFMQKKLDALVQKTTLFGRSRLRAPQIVILPWWDILINDKNTWSTAQNRSLVNSPISCGREDAGVTSWKFYRWQILSTNYLNTRNLVAVSSSITTPLGPPPPNYPPHPPSHKAIVLTWPPMGGRGEVSPTSSAWQTLSIPPPALIISTIIVIINIIVSIPPPALIINLSAPSSVMIHHPHHHHYLSLHQPWLLSS